MSGARRHRAFVCFVLAVGILLRWTTLRAGFGMDDFAQLGMLAGVYPVERAPWDLFTFSSGDPAEVRLLQEAGALPWWSHPDLKLRALRPLSSLLTALDVRLFGHDAFAHHVHSLLWWLVLLVVAAALLRRMLPGRWALLALLFYALDEAHTVPLAWLANRNAIVSAAFGFAAVWAHLGWREHGWRRGGFASSLLLAVAYAAGEYAVCAAVYLVTYELIAASGDARSRGRALIPMLVVTVTWAVVHHGLGYGAYGSATYVDPLREPLVYLQVVGQRVPVLLAEMVLGIPSAWLPFSPGLTRYRPWIGLAALVVVAVLVKSAWSRWDGPARRRIAWMGAAAVVSVFPVAPSVVSARLLLLPALAGHVVLSAVSIDAWDRLRAGRDSASLGRGIILAGMAAVHMGVAPWVGVRETLEIARVHRQTRAFVSSMRVDEPRVARSRLVVLAALDPMTLIYPPLARWLEGKPKPRSWWVLSMSPRPHRLHRIGPRSLELEVVGGAMLRGPVEQLFRRPDAALHEGDVVDLPGLEIRIMTVAPDGAPTRVRYTFERTLDDPLLQFLLVTPRGPIRYPMGPVGATMPIPAPALSVSGEPTR